MPLQLEVTGMIFDPVLLPHDDRPIRITKRLYGFDEHNFCTEEITIDIGTDDGEGKILSFIHEWEDAQKPMKPRQHVFVYEDKLPNHNAVFYHVLCVEFVKLVSTGPTSVSIRYKIAKSNKDDFEPHVDVIFTGMDNIDDEWLNNDIRVDRVKELASFCNRFCA